MSERAKIWVTQSLPRGEDSAKDYIELGLDPIVAPVLVMEPVSPIPPLPDKQTLLIFTSRNGVSAFAAMSNQRVNPVICVGHATAEMASAVGFVHVSSAGGDAQDVVKLVLRSVLRSQPIRHCCGKHVQGRIAEQLTDAGYQIERVRYYAASPVAKAGVDITKVNYVAIYSPRGAASFVDLVKGKEINHLTTLSISPAADAALEPLSLKNRLIAKAPDQRSMLAAIRPYIQDDLNSGSKG